MMRAARKTFQSQTLVLGLASVVLMLTTAAAFAQGLPGTENGEWRYIGGDAGQTRSSTLDQINGDNFEDLEVAWIWRTNNFGGLAAPVSPRTPVN